MKNEQATSGPKNPWVTYIKNRIKRNKNFICFIGGPTGSGKSWTSLSIAEQVDEKFNIDNIVFSGLELMNLINSGKLKSGSVIVFEEAGIDISNRNWQSLQNKVLNFLFQTFRHKRFILIMNSPYMDFIDKATRKLFHAEFITAGIIKEKKLVVIKPQLIQYNSRLDKFYYKYLRHFDGKFSTTVKRWGIVKPSQELIDVYEKKKTEFTTNLNKQIMEGLEKQKAKKPKEKWLCHACGYTWFPRTDNPFKCSKCQRKGCIVRERDATV